MADRQTTWRTTGSAAVAAAVVGLGAASALAGGGEEPANGPKPPPASGYECPLPPQLNPIDTETPADPFDARELKGLKMRRATDLAAIHGIF